MVARRTLARERKGFMRRLYVGAARTPRPGAMRAARSARVLRSSDRRCREWSVPRVAAALVVVLLLGLVPAPGRGEDAAAAVAALKGSKAECAYLHDLCAAARAAKGGAREAMAESRANHQRSRAMLTNDDGETTRFDVQRQDRAVQDHLTAAAQRRATTASAFDEAKKLITARHGHEPACGACPGL